MKPDYRPRIAALAAARAHLAEADPVMRRLIDAQPNLDPRAWLSTLPEMDTFGTRTRGGRGWRVEMSWR